MTARIEVAPAYMRYAADTLADFARLGPMEYGYLGLLEALAWREGGIDADAKGELARLLRLTPKRAAAVWAVVGREWEKAPSGRYALPWMEAQRAAAAARRATAQANGGKGGRPAGSRTRSDQNPAGSARDTQPEPGSNPDESFAVAGALTEDLAVVGGDAREGSTPEPGVAPASAQEEPAPPTDATSGALDAADVECSLAVALARAANQGVTEVAGEQPAPFLASSAGAADLAGACEAAGVPRAFAVRTVFDQARHFARRAGERGSSDVRPSALAYFAPAVLRAWAQDEAARDAAAHPAPTPLPRDAAGAPLRTSVAGQLAYFRSVAAGEPGVAGRLAYFDRLAAGGEG